MILSYLKENYKEGEPIFLSDIKIECISNDNLRYHLKKLTDDGLLNRFDSGVYYFSKKNFLGEKAIISPETVAIYKYIKRNNKNIGFYSGYTLKNKLGLLTQVPIKEEITSNNSSMAVKEISIKNRKFIIRKPFIEINEDNIYVLQFLDCLKDIEKGSDLNMMECGKILTDFAFKHNITKELVDKYIYFYPIKIYKSIYETGVKYVSTQK